jgi:hypothetical protein
MSNTSVAWSKFLKNIMTERILMFSLFHRIRSLATLFAVAHFQHESCVSPVQSTNLPFPQHGFASIFDVEIDQTNFVRLSYLQ